MNIPQHDEHELYHARKRGQKKTMPTCKRISLRNPHEPLKTHQESVKNKNNKPKVQFFVKD